MCIVPCPAPFIDFVNKIGIFTRSPLLWIFFPLSFFITVLFTLIYCFNQLLHTHKVDTEDNMLLLNGINS